MIREDYVSLEAAKLLKDKGYKNPCNSSILINGELRIYNIKQNIEDMTSIGDKYYEFLCPTLYDAQKWIREEKKLQIEISYMYGDYFIYEILTIPTHNIIGFSNKTCTGYKSYEEALIEGIIEALKLS